MIHSIGPARLPHTSIFPKPIECILLAMHHSSATASTNSLNVLEGMSSRYLKTAGSRSKRATAGEHLLTAGHPPLGRYEDSSGAGYVETSQNHERGLIKIDGTSVVSPETVRDYSILPAAAGIRQLLADGSLVGPDDARFKAAYDKWNERISRPYRSKLDPDFVFSYKVNYLTTRPMTLPAGLDRIALLVGEGVETPDMNGNHYKACLYYADLRELQLDPHKSGDPRCTGRPFLGGSLVLSESERSIATMALSFGPKQQASQADKDKCKGLTIASDAYFAGIAVSEGAAWRSAGQNASPRRIDVIVKRPGRVALYLEMWARRTNWHIFPLENTQITDVVLGDLASRKWSEVHGLSPSIPVQTIPVSSGCSPFYPGGHAYLGGPAVLALDRDLQVLAGRGLDTLLRNTNDGSWPPVVSDQDAPRVTLVIE